MVWVPATGHRPPATGHRPPATGHRPPEYLNLAVTIGRYRVLCRNGAADVRRVNWGATTVNVGAYRVWNSRVGYVVIEGQNARTGAWHSVLWQGDAANGLRDLLDTTDETFTVHDVVTDIFVGHPYNDCDCNHTDIVAHVNGYYSHTLLYRGH